MKTLKSLLTYFGPSIIVLIMLCMFYGFKASPPPNYCVKITSINLTTDAFDLSVDGVHYIIIVGDKSTSIIRK